MQSGSGLVIHWLLIRFMYKMIVGIIKSPKIRGWSIPDKFISGQWNHTSVYEALDETFTPHQTTPDTLDVYSSWLPNNAYIKIKDSSAREKNLNYGGNQMPLLMTKLSVLVWE